MKTTQHTPGPWEYKTKAVHATEILAKSGVSICHLNHWGKPEKDLSCDPKPTGQNEANARLISAAPELLDACKMALEFVVATHGSENDGDIQEQLRQAIAKAEGK